MEQLNSNIFDVEILEEVKLKDKEALLSVDLIYTSKPYKVENEILILVDKPKDNRLYKDVDIIIEPTLASKTTPGTLLDGLKDILNDEMTNFKYLGANRYLYYGRVLPIKRND